MRPSAGSALTLLSTPFGRFAAALFSGHFVAQSLLVVAGAYAHATLGMTSLAGFILPAALLAAASAALAGLLSRDFRGRLDPSPRFRVLAGTLTLLPLFFSTVSSQAFDTPKWQLLASAGALLLGLTGRRRRHLPGLLRGAAPACLALFLLALLAGSFRGNVVVGLEASAAFALLAFLALVAAEEGGGENGRALLTLLVAGSLAPLALGFAQYNGFEPTGVFQNPGERARVFSTLGNVNWYGSYLVLLFAASLALAETLADRIALTATCGVAALAFVSCLLTQSRAAWGALLVVILARAFFAFLAPRDAAPPADPFRRRLRLAAAAGALLALLHFSVLSPLNSQFRIADRLAATFRGDHNVIQRGLIWRVAWGMFRERPLTGNGTGTFARDYLERQRAFFLSRAAAGEGGAPFADPLLPYGGNARETHNEYLQILAENGLAGALPFAGFLIAQAALALAAARRRGMADPESRMALTLAAGCAGILAEAALAFPFRVPVSAALFFAFAGLAYPRLAGIAPVEAPPSRRAAALLPAAAAGAGILLAADAAADVSVMLGQEYMKYGGYREAEPHLRRALTLNPLRGDARFLLGSSLVGQGRAAAAEPLLLSALAVTNDRGVANNLGFARQAQGDLRGALDWFLRGWYYEPRAAETANNVAMTALKLGDRARAEDFLGRALAANPFYLTARNNLGDLHLTLGRLDSAEAELSAILELHPDAAVRENFNRRVYAYTDRATLMAEYGRAWYGLARLAAARGDEARAARAFTEALKFVPDSSLVNLEAGRFECGRGRADLGRPLLARAARIADEHGRAAAALLAAMEKK